MVARCIGQSSSNCEEASLYRPVDGSCNHINFPTLGMSYGTFTFLGLEPQDRDNIGLPNERTLSNNLFHSELNVLSSVNISMAEIWFGQFLNHDQEYNVVVHDHYYRINLEENDDDFLILQPDMDHMSVPYSLFSPDDNGTVSYNISVNGQTPYFDLSTIYGYNDQILSELRAFENGLMKTIDYHLCLYDSTPPPFGNGVCIEEYVMPDLPISELEAPSVFNDLGLNDFGQDPSALFATGDYRGNENIGLASMQVVFLREHNRLAAMLQQQHPEWDDETLFQEARKLNIGVYQSIVIDEYLPAIIGEQAYETIKTPYQGYNPYADPRTSVPFASAAFRYGHSSVRQYRSYDKDGCPINTLPEWNKWTFLHPNEPPFLGSLGPMGFTIPELVYFAGNWENLVYSIVYQRSAEIDNIIDDSFRNIGDGFNPLDIFSADIARGRMNSLPDYHTIRTYYFEPIYDVVEGCPTPSDPNAIDDLACFLAITSDVEEAAKLREFYGRLDRVDCVVGLLHEDHFMDSAVGPTTARILVQEYERKRESDRFWYENDQFDEQTMEYIRERNIIDIVNDNFGTEITSFFRIQEMPVCSNPSSVTTDLSTGDTVSDVVTSGTDVPIDDATTFEIGGSTTVDFTNDIETDDISSAFNLLCSIGFLLFFLFM